MTLERKTWWINSLWPIIVVLGGFVVQWTTMRVSLADVKDNQSKIESRLNDTEKKLEEVAIKSAVNDNDMETIKKDLSEIKKDIKTILGRNNK